MAWVLAFFLVIQFCTVCSYGEQIVIQSIDAEDGMMRSDEDTYELDRIRIGAGESDDRTFISIISFDTTILDGITVNAAQIAITVMNNHIWDNPNPDPDQFGPTIDVDTAFSGNIAFQCPQDRDASADAFNVDNEAGAWGLTGAEIGKTIYIDLGPTAIAAINTSGRTQFRINSGTASGSNDDAIDFYDGGNFLNSPLLIINPTGGGPGDPLDLIFNPNNLQPTGEYYEANVPDTLDLAERAKIAVEGFANIINWPDHNYAPYGHIMFNYNPPYATDYWGPGRNNWGKILEPLVLLRRMCGSSYNIDIEPNSWKSMIDHIGQEGCKAQRARAEMALKSLYETNQDPLLKDLIENLKQEFYTGITYEGDYAYYSNDPPDLDNSPIGIQNYVSQTHDHGSQINFLSQWYHVTGDANDLDLAGKISRFVRLAEFWEPQTEPEFFTGAERAHFKGHIHSYLTALMGMLQYADTANEAWLKEFVRNGYEWIRNTGIARIGLFGETCNIGEMTILAVELSEAGIGDYWEDVDQYVRNHLTEMQVLDANALQAVVDLMPPPTGYPSVDEVNDILARNIGTFFTDGGHPAMIPSDNLRNTICCTGNGAKGFCYAWKSIVQCDQDGVAKVNLLLNRASPWLDIDSYLPYEGKVVVRNKTANKISVRIPRWVDKSAVTCKVNEEPTSLVWVANYLDLSRLRSGDVITIEFPMVETTETYTLKWRHTDWAWESNWEPTYWDPLSDPDRFTCHFRGNTLVDISPRVSGLGYQLYQRDHLIGATAAPMKTVTRFVHSCDFAPEACTDKPIGDFDGDCRVTLADFTKIASEWLHCGFYDQGRCW